MIADLKLGMCPCCSGLKYASCCKPFHDGAQADDALALMRSRFSAYAMGLTDYIVMTTHPDQKDYKKDREEWKDEIREFSKGTKFLGLKILDFQDGRDQAFVRFRAHIEQKGRDASFTENSRFKKAAGRWLYLEGHIG